MKFITQKLCRIGTKVAMCWISSSTVPYRLTLIHMGGGPKRWNVLFNKLFNNSSKFHEICWLSVKFISTFILEFFKKCSNWFFAVSTFFTTKCYFLYMSSAGMMNISMAILVIRVTNWWFIHENAQLQWPS